MDDVHDLGGMNGLGPVIREKDEPTFHAEWEEAVFAMFPAAFVKGYFNLDQFRYGMEQMHPADYLTSRYYEHWLHSIEHHLRHSGIVDAAELDRRTRHYLEHPDEPLPDAQDRELVGTLEGVMTQGASKAFDSLSTLEPLRNWWYSLHSVPISTITAALKMTWLARSMSVLA